nr:hypothetical protein [Tanacetum cinerariifolium]
APPSPVYIPYVPEPVYPEYIPPEDDVFPAEKQPPPAAASPTAESPGYILDEPTVKKHVVETSEAKASTDKPKFVRKNFGSPLIEDWISDSEDEDESNP